MSEIDGKLLPEPQAVKWLRRYGIPYPEHALARNGEEAVRVAEGLGYPVVLKVVSADIVHKSDVGAVAVGLREAKEVVGSFSRLLENVATVAPDAKVNGVLVAKQAPAGREVIAGGIVDPVFGPTVMFGLGGIFTEVLRDVTFRIAPLELRDAREMLQEVRAYPVLAGLRGEKPCDLDALAEVLMALSQMMVEHEEIQEIDLNPLRVFERGLTALDARIILRSRSVGKINPRSELGAQGASLNT